MDPTVFNSQLVSADTYHGRPTGYAADREFQADYLDRLIVHTGYGERLQTPEQRIELIDSLTGDDFVNLIQAMDRILLNLPPDTPALADVTNVSYHSSPNGMPTGVVDIHPVPEDKIPLLHELLAVAQSVPELELKALILGIGINLVHPVNEGNGGIARGIYHLLTNDYQPGDEGLRVALAHVGRSEIFLDPRILYIPVMEDIKLRLGTHARKGAGLIAAMPIEATRRSFSPIEAAESRQGQATSAKAIDVLAMLIHDDFGTMLPMLVARNYDSAITQASILPETWNTPQVFSIDHFWDNATEEEIDEYYQAFRELKNTIIREALRQLTLGEESMTVDVPLKGGRSTPWPVAQLTREVTHAKTGKAPNLLRRIEKALGTVIIAQQSARPAQQAVRAKKRKK